MFEINTIYHLSLSQKKKNTIYHVLHDKCETPICFTYGQRKILLKHMKKKKIYNNKFTHVNIKRHVVAPSLARRTKLFSDY